MILEMPTYKRPSLRSVLMQMMQRAKMFIVRAGTIILGISILIWAASTYPKDRDIEERIERIDAEIKALGKSNEAKVTELKHQELELKSQHLAQSFAGQAGHLIEPAIKPLGYDWKIGIGIFGSFAAREVFGSTMSIVYAVEDGDSEDQLPLRERIQKERRPDGSPVFTPLVCLSLLVFYVYAMMCVSTVVIVRRETSSWGWALFQFSYMTGTAYIASLLVFQVGTALGF
jgi:ferrous iron transport protein B